MRGMIKWKPFNTLLRTSDILLLSKQKEIEEKPSISKDRIIKINRILKEAIENKLGVQIKYWHINKIIYMKGKIEKINAIEKYILVNNYRMYFKNIIDINIIGNFY